jgi:hypothetical protein
MLSAQPSKLALEDGTERELREADIDLLRKNLETALETLSPDHQEVLTASWPPPSAT